MNATVISALIGATATVAGPIVTYFITKRSKTPGTRESGFQPRPIAGQWNGVWSYEENGQINVHSRDTIHLDKIDGFDLRGRGHDPKFDEPYAIEGFATARDRFALSYRFKESAKAYVGVVLLELDDLGERFEGEWFGYTVKGKRGGPVVWERSSGEKRT